MMGGFVTKGNTNIVDGLTNVSCELSFGNTENHEIVKIDILDVGFHVLVGCKSLAFESKKDLLKALEMYIDDPAKARKKYLKE